MRSGSVHKALVHLRTDLVSHLRASFLLLNFKMHVLTDLVFRLCESLREVSELTDTPGFTILTLSLGGTFRSDLILSPARLIRQMQKSVEGQQLEEAWYDRFKFSLQILSTEVAHPAVKRTTVGRGAVRKSSSDVNSSLASLSSQLAEVVAHLKRACDVKKGEGGSSSNRKGESTVVTDTKTAVASAAYFESLSEVILRTQRKQNNLWHSYSAQDDADQLRTGRNSAQRKQNSLRHSYSALDDADQLRTGRTSAQSKLNSSQRHTSA
ncbi:hypothetical protein F511_39799 [Dorcoceras hygrometricum]|uniref:Uncharacterized protein n=1 Tax=Dorcoceras hygrometricum TaxID=472368 RepID=A0A2Z7C2Q9_9LAMI|nr:hypothetical protein F511_39799 [Dorcoceras hygrometricum]